MIYFVCTLCTCSTSHLKFSHGTLLQLSLGLLAQCFAQDLPRWVLGDRLEEHNPASDPLYCGYFAFHEVDNLICREKMS